MRISELIGRLEAIKTEHGNVHVEMLHGLALEYGRRVIHREAVREATFYKDAGIALVVTASVRKGDRQ